MADAFFCRSAELAHINELQNVVLKGYFCFVKLFDKLLIGKDIFVTEGNLFIIWDIFDIIFH